MKHWLVLGLAVLVGCGGESEPAAEPTTTKPESKADRICEQAEQYPAEVYDRACEVQRKLEDRLDGLELDQQP